MIKKYGLNKSLNKKAYKKYGLNLRAASQIITAKQKKLFTFFFRSFFFDKKLKNIIRRNIKFIIMHKTFKGIRHKNKFPARGQRTHTNAKTAKKVKGLF